MSLSARELATLVKKMRGKQREFFIARRHGGAGTTLLEECKILEKQVDKAVAEVLGDKGPGLFAEGDE